MFRHFETRSEANAYAKENSRWGDQLTVRKKHGKHKKPYAVATAMTHLHFTPDSWVKKKKLKRGRV